MIKKLTYREIDFVKYAECLANAVQKNVFAQRHILDFLCESWELLVWEDYQYVMPLPLKNRFGQKIITCPIFCQQLGIYGPDDDLRINAEFLSYTLQNCNTYLYSFNVHNTFSRELNQRKNYFIKRGPYELQRRKYSKGRKSSVKSGRYLLFERAELSADVLTFIRSFHKGLEKKADLELFIKYVRFLNGKNMLKMYGAYLEDALLTLTILIDDGTTVYLLGLVSDEKYRNENPTSFIVDRLLQNFIDTRHFSFMGSNVRSIGVFNSSFGAELQEYSVIQYSKKGNSNELPENKISIGARENALPAHIDLKDD